MQHVFDRGRALVLTAEHGRMVRVRGEGCLVGVLAAGAGELRHRGLRVSSAHPVALGTELESAELRLVLDDVDGGEQGGCVDAVEGNPGLRRGDGMCGHDCIPSNQPAESLADGWVSFGRHEAVGPQDVAAS